MARTSDFRVFSLSMPKLERDLLCVAVYKIIDTGRHKKVHTLLRMAGSWGQTMLRPTWRLPLSRATKLGGLVPHGVSLLSRVSPPLSCFDTYMNSELLCILHARVHRA